MVVKSAGISKSDQKTAYEMALSGFDIPSVSQQIGIDYRQSKYFFDSLEKQGYPIQKQQRKQRLRGSFTLLPNREGKIQITLLMQVYFKLVGSHSDSAPIQLSSLQKAFRLCQRIQSVNKINDWMDIDIGDAWSMARELQDKKAYIKYCRSCEVSYFSSIHQHTTINCPFCPNKCSA